MPLHATGVGKVLLAHAPPDIIDEAMKQLGRVTRYTITQPTRLREQLEQVRRNGYSTTSEELTLGACSVAVPIRASLDGERPQEVVAALGVVVGSLRRDRGRLVSAMQVAAHGIERSLAASRSNA